MQKKNSFSIIKQLMPALKVNIIIVHPWDVVFLRAKALEKTTTHKTNILEHYTLRFYFPYLSLLAQPVNIIQLMPALKVNIIIVHPWDVYG
jgi:ABC-type sugar transport system substrate-binding protein